MSFELESDLEDAGIDAFEFSLMDEDERREALEDAGLDTDTYLDADLDSDFNAWSDLQPSGLSIQELKWLDDNERKDVLKNSGLDPDDYDELFYDKYSHYPSKSIIAEQTTPLAENCIRSNEKNDLLSPKEDDFLPITQEKPHLQVEDSPTEEATSFDDNQHTAVKKTPWAINIAVICILVCFVGFGAFSYKEQQQRIALEAQIEEDQMRHAEEAYQLGMQLHRQEKYKDAADAFSFAKEKSVGYAELYYEICQAHVCYETQNYSTAIHRMQSLTKKADIPGELLQEAKLLIQEAERAQKEYEQEQHRRFLENLKKSVPYVGMSEDYIAKTSLGSPTLKGHNRQVRNGAQLLANLYDYYNSNGEVIYSIRCIEGKVTEVWDWRDTPHKPTSIGKTSRSTSSSEKKSKDPYHASSFAHPDDFYEWYYDDFWDYEEAEEYWEKHHEK